MSTLSIAKTTSLPCPHAPECPAATAPDHDAAKTLHDHHADGGFIVLCNGVTVFDDGGEILPGGQVIPAHRPEPQRRRGVGAARRGRLGPGMSPLDNVAAIRTGWRTGDLDRTEAIIQIQKATGATYLRAADLLHNPYEPAERYEAEILSALTAILAGHQPSTAEPHPARRVWQFGIASAFVTLWLSIAGIACWFANHDQPNKALVAGLLFAAGSAAFVSWTFRVSSQDPT
jgi:hypothetical protein